MFNDKYNKGDELTGVKKFLFSSSVGAGGELIFVQLTKVML